MHPRKYTYALALGFLLVFQCMVTASAEAVSLDVAQTRKDSSPGTVQRFATAYTANKKPRISIFLNRTLSDDIREWRTTRRGVITGEGAVTSSSETPLRYREQTVKGPVAAYEQEYNGSSGERNNADESAIWSFEDGFMQMFLHAGTTLIDRGTVMRLLSRKSSQGVGKEDIEVKKTEMDALVDNVDVFIELLVARYPSAPTGYEFRAVAKEVKTGRILASATSLNWDPEKYRPKKVVATEKGYEIVDDDKMPRIADVSRDLAIDVMNSLMASWGNR